MAHNESLVALNGTQVSLFWKSVRVGLCPLSHLAGA